MLGGPPWKLAKSWYLVPLPITASMALTSLCLSAAPKCFTFRLTLLAPPQPDVFLSVLVSSTVEVVVVVVVVAVVVVVVVVVASSNDC